MCFFFNNKLMVYQERSDASALIYWGGFNEICVYLSFKYFWLFGHSHIVDMKGFPKISFILNRPLLTLKIGQIHCKNGANSAVTVCINKEISGRWLQNNHQYWGTFDITPYFA